MSLAKLLLTPSNLLILDEPTNHLDMRSKDILKNALLQYDGTLIVVSHDRDFLQGLTNRIFEFRKGGIREYIGDIYDFLETRKIRSFSQLEMAQSKKVETVEKSAAVSLNKQNREKKKNAEKEVRKVQNQIGKVETEIAKLEEEIRKTEEMLIQPEKFKDKVIGAQLYNEYEHLRNRLAVEMKNWEELQELLENSAK